MRGRALRGVWCVGCGVWCVCVWVCACVCVLAVPAIVMSSRIKIKVHKRTYMINCMVNVIH